VRSSTPSITESGVCGWKRLQDRECACRDQRVDGAEKEAAAEKSVSLERNMIWSIWVVYRIRHFFLLLVFRVVRAERVACSNTSLTPSLVLAEHSRYFAAPIFLRTSSAWGDC